jgi:hypothetical protein
MHDEKKVVVDAAVAPANADQPATYCPYLPTLIDPIGHITYHRSRGRSFDQIADLCGRIYSASRSRARSCAAGTKPKSNAEGKPCTMRKR